jgi:hypothetical protein
MRTAYPGATSRSECCQCRDGVVVGVVGRSVRHIQQRSSWDCGLACCAMVVQLVHGAAVTLDEMESLWVHHVQRYGVPEESIPQATWTLDLFAMLRQQFQILGRDPAVVTMTTMSRTFEEELYSDYQFYRAGLGADLQRQARLIEAAQAERWPVATATHVDTNVMFTKLSQGGVVFVVLVNSLLLDCPCSGRAVDLVRGAVAVMTAASSVMGCLRTCAGCPRAVAAGGASADALLPYVGHYVLACGVDVQRQTVVFADPAKRTGLCVSSMESFCRALTFRGTDEDVIRINL